MSDNLPRVSVLVYSKCSVMIQTGCGETAERRSLGDSVLNVMTLQAIAMTLQAGRVQTVGLQ